MGDVLVLGYHGVSPTWPAVISISPALLGDQLELLVKRGYRGATFTEAVTAAPYRKTLAVTFDDGYASTLDALPILNGLGLVGTVFVVTDWPERGRPMSWPHIDQWLGGPHERELMPLTWRQLRVLADAGWEIGSHTCSHPHLRSLDDARLKHELELSRLAIESRLRGRCTSVAYPYGEVDGRVQSAGRRAGYTAGAAQTWRLRRGGRLAWPRVAGVRGESIEHWRQRVGPLTRWLVGTAVGDRVLAAERIWRVST
jgi:peptidoglycan/xylan/chitin deacetylase (PgdA/CDA1 family)